MKNTFAPEHLIVKKTQVFSLECHLPRPALEPEHSSNTTPVDGVLVALTGQFIQAALHEA
jgi:hypothetical protein